MKNLYIISAYVIYKLYANNKTLKDSIISFSHYFAKNAGTAGVWRIAAIDEAGGWKDRTTVEDMDLAVRASLRGWKFVYLGDLQVLFFGYFLSYVSVTLPY